MVGAIFSLSFKVAANVGILTVSTILAGLLYLSVLKLMFEAVSLALI